MKPWIKAAPEALLAAAATGLLVLAAVPSPREAAGPARPLGASRAQAAAKTADSPAELADPDAVVRLFYMAPPPVEQAPVEPAAAAAPEPEPAKPLEAPWLSYVGHFSGMDGKPFYYVKDSRSGRLIKVSRDDTSDWILVEDAAERIVVRHGDGLYAVPRKR